MGFLLIKKNVELKSPFVTVYLGTMTGCTGGGHPTMQSYNPFRGLHLEIITRPLDVWIKKTRDERGFGGKSLILERIPTLSHTEKKNN